MEMRKTRCEKCGSEIEFTLFSKTLSQVVKCSHCFSRFTYDPAKQEETGARKEKSGDTPGEDTGAKDSKPKEEAGQTKPQQELHCPECEKEFMVALPEKKKKTAKTICPRCGTTFSFKREDWTFEGLEPGDVHRAPPPMPQEPETRPQPEEMEYDKEIFSRGEEEAVGSEGAEDKVMASAVTPVGTEASEDNVKPPALTPEDEKPGKEDEKPEDTRKEEELPPPEETPQKVGKEGKQEISCPECGFQFEVMLPKVKKREVLTLCPLCSHEFSFQRADYFFSDETDESLEKKELPPPPREMEYGGDEHPVRERFENLFVYKYIEKSKDIALSFIDFDFHSIKESLLPANVKEHVRKKTGIAAILLFIVFLLGMTNAFATLLFGLGQDADEGAGNKVTIAGTIYFEDDVVEGARVELVGHDETYHTTPEGRYWFYNVSSGKITIKVTHEDYGKATVKTEIKDREGELPQEIDIILPEKGEENSRDLSSDSDEGMNVSTIFFLTFLVFIIATLFALLGGISCLLSRNFKTAKYGAFVGILSFGFLIGSILAFIAVILILFSKSEFEKTSFSEDDPDDYSEEEEEQDEIDVYL